MFSHLAIYLVQRSDIVIFIQIFDTFIYIMCVCTFSRYRLFLQSPANPDLLYIIFFCHTQLTVTLLLALIFGSKVSLVVILFIHFSRCISLIYFFHIFWHTQKTSCNTHSLNSFLFHLQPCASHPKPNLYSMSQQLRVSFHLSYITHTKHNYDMTVQSRIPWHSCSYTRTNKCKNDYNLENGVLV